MGSLRSGLAAFVLATVSCGEPEPAPGEAADPRPGARTPQDPAGDARPVVHLVDAWPRVRALDSVLTDLDPEMEVEWSSQDLRRIPELGDLPLLPLDWPLRAGSLRVQDGPREIPLRSSLAEMIEQGGAVWLARTRRFEAENLMQFEDLQRARLQDHAVLKEGEEWSLALDLPGRPAVLRVRLRGWPLHVAAVDVRSNGEPLTVLDAIGEEWSTRDIALDAPAGTHRISLHPRLVSGTSRRGHLVTFDWAELEQSLGDVVVLEAGLGGDGLRVRARPTAPSPVQRLTADVFEPGRIALLRLAGPARLYAEAGAGGDADRTLPVPASPGLHRVALPAGAEHLVLEQPAAALLPYLEAPRMRLRDDSTWDRRHEGALSAEIADRVLSRLECQDDRRAGFLLPAPSSLDVDVDLTAGDRLRFSVGVGDLPESESGNRRTPTTFELAARTADGEEIALWSGRRRQGEPWLDVELAVDARLAGPVTLRLSTSGGDPGESPASGFADPRVVPATPARERPNLLLYLIDTLRADRLSCYGGPNPTSPRLDALAADGLRFTSFHAVAAHTRPSTASVLTGLHPRYHAASGLDRSLPLYRLTLAEILRDAGLSNLAFIANNQVAGRGIHFEQGFHRFMSPMAFTEDGRTSATAEELNREILPWIDGCGDEPFFAYVHSIDPHTPYAPPVGERNRFDPDYRGPLHGMELSNAQINQLLRAEGLDDRDRRYLLAVYDAQIRYQDDQIGVLLDRLEQQGLLQDTVIAVISDHGEEFGEHQQYYHGGRMWKQLIDVPLILWIPPRWRGDLEVGRTIDVRASHLDLLPTLLELLGVDAPTTWQGDSLVPWMRGAPPQDRLYLGQDRDGIGAVVQGGYKLIWFDRRGSMEMTYGLFDLENDPDELHNLAAERPEVVERMLALVQDAHRDFEARGFDPVLDPERVELDAEAERQLRALGYMEDQPPQEQDPRDQDPAENDPPPSDPREPHDR